MSLVPDSAALRVQPGARMATPLCRLAGEFAALTGWRRYGLGFLLGALLAGAFPPVDLVPLTFLLFPALLWLDDGSMNKRAPIEAIAFRMAHHADWIKRRPELDILFNIERREWKEDVHLQLKIKDMRPAE